MPLRKNKKYFANLPLKREFGECQQDGVYPRSLIVRFGGSKKTIDLLSLDQGEFPTKISSDKHGFNVNRSDLKSRL
jgi:hypothetical protein